MEPLESIPLTASTVPQYTPLRSFFRNVPWRWSDVLIYCAPDIVFWLLAWLWPPSFVVVGPSWIWLLFIVLSQAWWLGYPLWVARRRGGTLPGPPRRGAVLAQLKWLPLVAPAAFAAMIIVDSAVESLRGPGATPSEGWLTIARSGSRGELVGLVLLAVIVAPLAEEVGFRGFLYNKLRQSFPVHVALGLQAAVFGLAHIPLGVSLMFATGTAGLAFGLFYEWRKTLVAPILLHASINVIGMTFMLANVAADAAAPKLGVYGEVSERGCVVTKVVRDSAAARVGLKAGDVVTSLDGVPVRDILQISQIIRRKRVGDRVTIEFTREGKPERVAPVLTRLPN